MARTRTAALSEGVAAVLIWGVSFIATKIALRELAPINLVWLRFAIGVGVLTAAAVGRRELARVPARHGLALALLGVQGITFHQWLQSTALVTSQASTSGWIIGATPVLIAVLAAAVLGEHLAGAQVVGVALAFAGVTVVVSGGDLAAFVAGRAGAPGDVLIVASALNWAVFSVLSRSVLRAQPPARAMLVVMAAGWLGSTLLLPAGPGLREVATLSPTSWGAILFLGVACSGLAYVFWFDALHHVPAAQVGALLYLEPFAAQIAAAALLGEPLQPAVIAGGVVILLGVWLVNRRPPLAAAPRQ